MSHIRVLYIVSFILLASTHGFQWYCNSDADCTTKDTSCTEVGLCQCKDGMIFTSDGTECIALATGPDYFCKEQRQCTDFIFGPVSCTEGACQCDRGYRYLASNTTCIKFKYLNEECNEDVDCYDDADVNAMKCKDKKCTCNDGYYNRGDVDCRLSAKVSNACMFDIDCQSETQYCKTEYTAVGTCVEKDAPTTTTISTTITTTTTTTPPPPTITTDDSTTTTDDTTTTEVITTTTEGPDIGIPCTTDDECEAENSHCSKLFKTCTCNKLYYYDAATDTCIPTLGQTCQEKCSKNAECVNGKCQCKPYYINGFIDGKCFKPAKNVNHSCANNKNCYSFGRYAMCSDAKCVCRSQKFDDHLMICVLEASVGSACLDNDQCVLENTECNNGKCLCKKNFIASDEKTCSLELGQSCAGQENFCKIDNAACISDTCACKEGYLNIDNTTCLAELTSVNGTCNSDDQCMKLLKGEAQCIDNKCICTDAYKLVDGHCALKRYMGDVCTSRKDCQLVLNGDVRCRNSQCTCAYGHRMTEDKLECIVDNGSISINQGYFLQYSLILAFTIYLFNS